MKVCGELIRVSACRIIHRDAAGSDVGNESHFVSVPPDRNPQPIREFGSWTAALEEMARWLKDCRIRTVGMALTWRKNGLCVSWVLVPCCSED